MTAEIAILNNGAVALAADSAVTWNTESAAKIYNTVNKLFTLSKYHPVGIMVYGGAELMGVPWESIIKVYREQAGARSRAKLEDYAEDFLRFLGDSRALFPADSQRTYVGRVAQRYFKRIRADLDARVKERTDSGAEITNDQIGELAQTLTLEHLESWQQSPFLKGIGDQDVDASITDYETVVDEAIVAVFESLVLPGDVRLRLHRIAANLLSREQSVAGSSGVVIAGFGEFDFTPVLVEFSVRSVVLN